MGDTSIVWVNHAGYLLQHGEVGLLVDPWLFGSVFDHGWDLVAPTVFSDGGWAAVTHLWISHEHPDHFHPPSLLSIPEADRQRITVLLQQTPDHRMAAWCRTRFGRVVELEPGQWLPLGVPGDGKAADVEVRCVPHDNGDSWLLQRTPDGTFLNLNDCVVNSELHCRRIRDLVGRPDVLLTQFGCANWTGNPGDTASLRSASEEKLSWVITQARVLEPQVVIPAASFSWFSHEDNAHLNDGKIPLVEVDRQLRAAGPEVQFLYPGDCWELGGAGDRAMSDAAIARYESDADGNRARPLRAGETVGLADLCAAAIVWADRLTAKNGQAVRLLPAARVHVWDLGCTLLLDHRGLRPVPIDPDHCDIRVRSDALARAVGEEYGGRTLDINGRFSVPPHGHYRRFKAYMTLAAFNARDESWAEIFATVRRRAMAKASSVVDRPLARPRPR